MGNYCYTKKATEPLAESDYFSKEVEKAGDISGLAITDISSDVISHKSLTNSKNYNEVVTVVNTNEIQVTSKTDKGQEKLHTDSETADSVPKEKLCEQQSLSVIGSLMELRGNILRDSECQEKAKVVVEAAEETEKYATEALKNEQEEIEVTDVLSAPAQEIVPQTTNKAETTIDKTFDSVTAYSENAVIVVSIASSSVRRVLSTAEVILLPHTHTLFCERKQRVCTAVGKLQELEVLRVEKLSTAALRTGNWIRVKDVVNGVQELLSIQDEDAFQDIAGSGGAECYTLSSEDVGSFIGFKYSENGDVLFAKVILGPVLPGPPRLISISVAGTCRVGEELSAKYDYIGGTEGASEFWWLKVDSEGRREQLSEPQSRYLSGVVKGGADPSKYYPSEKDIGCTLKVKCRPVRIDGHQGEIFTSKSCAKITN